MISHSTVVEAGDLRAGAGSSVSGSWPSSLKQGIWMMSFIAPNASRRSWAHGSGILVAEMDAAIVTEPAAPRLPSLGAGSGSRGARRRSRASRSGRGRSGCTGWRSRVLLVVALLLRLWGIKQGLPYSYNTDEATHFVPRAIGFFGHDLNPHYFLNPPAYSYLLYIVFELWFGGADAVAHAYTTDPDRGVRGRARRRRGARDGRRCGSPIWPARGCSGARVGLLAAAILGGRVPAGLLQPPGAQRRARRSRRWRSSLYGIAGVLRRGRTRDYVVAGVGIGLAAATKYTGGIMLVCLLGGGRRRRRPARSLAARCAASRSRWRAGAGGVRGRQPVRGARLLGVPVRRLPAGLAGGGPDPVKLGTPAGSGIAYYLWTFTWGLGWGPTLAALGGAALLLRAAPRRDGAACCCRRRSRFIIFMGDQQRFFGRWLMPIFPIVALLAAYGAVELVRWLARPRRVPAARSAGGARRRCCCSARASSPTSTTTRCSPGPTPATSTRAWMVAHVPAGAKVVIEPLVPDNWAMDIGVSLPATPTGERWWRYPTWLTDARPARQPAPRRASTGTCSSISTSASCIRRCSTVTSADGYCWLVIGSLQAGRAFAQPRRRPAAIAYYAAARAARAARLPRQPVRDGRAPGAVQLRLVDRLLPAPVPAPGPGDERLPADGREMRLARPESRALTASYPR